MDSLLQFQAGPSFMPPPPSFSQFGNGVMTTMPPMMSPSGSVGSSAASASKTTQSYVSGTKRVPLFIRRLWECLCDKSYDDVLAWAPHRTQSQSIGAASLAAAVAASLNGPKEPSTTTSSGATKTIAFNKEAQASFVIFDTSEFCERVLPKLLKFANYTIFVRQLADYGFERAPVPPSTASSASGGAMTGNVGGADAFYHPSFKKGAPHLLRFITRNRKTAEPPVDTQKESATPNIQTLVMQLAMLQLQAQESRAIVEAVKQEVISSQQRQTVLQEFTTRLAASASASPRAAAVAAAFNSSSQPSSQTSSASSTPAACSLPDPSTQFFMQQALDKNRQDIQLNQGNNGQFGFMNMFPNQQQQQQQVSFPQQRQMSDPAVASTAHRSLDSFFDTYSNPVGQAVPSQVFYSSGDSYSSTSTQQFQPPTAQQQIVSPPQQQPQFLAPRPPKTSMQQAANLSSSNTQFMQFVQGLSQLPQQEQPSQPQPKMGFLLPQQPEQHPEQPLMVKPSPSSTLNVPPEDPIALNNGNYSPVGDDTGVLLEDIPQNMMSRLPESPGSSAFSDDTERMYWERYMDPNHL